MKPEWQGEQGREAGEVWERGPRDGSQGWTCYPPLPPLGQGLGEGPRLGDHKASEPRSGTVLTEEAELRSAEPRGGVGGSTPSGTQ